MRVQNVNMEIPRFLGQNTATSFTEIDIKQSPKVLNCLPGKIGSLKRRPGTAPLTDTAIGEIKVLCNLRVGNQNSILSTSGTTLYKFNSGTKKWVAQTMTKSLTSAEIDYAQFKDASSNEVLVIADGGKLKYYNGTAVNEVTPAANDTTPLPPNDLANINTQQPPTGCIIHNNRVVIWDQSDTIHHSKPGFYDYFPQTNYQRFVRENDYIQTCVSFQGALLIMMRRHIGVLFGDGYNTTPTQGDWAQDFLDTQEGCLNGKTVQLVTFPDGRQEIFYMSDRGIQAVYRIDTLSMDDSARYSTKSVTADKIDWDALGVSKSEWQRATTYFRDGNYWLIYPKGSQWLGLVFNTDNQEWYPIDNIKSNSFYADEDNFYYVGSEGHLKIVDNDLLGDFTDVDKTTGSPINSYWYSKLLNPKVTGYDHFWDCLLIEARQFEITSSVDVEVNTLRGNFELEQALKTTYLVIGKSKIGEAMIMNPNFTDFVLNPDRIETFLKGQYAQVKLSNNRYEPFEIFSLKYEVRAMDR